MNIASYAPFRWYAVGIITNYQNLKPIMCQLPYTTPACRYGERHNTNYYKCRLMHSIRPLHKRKKIKRHPMSIIVLRGSTILTYGSKKVQDVNTQTHVRPEQWHATRRMTSCIVITTFTLLLVIVQGVNLSCKISREFQFRLRNVKSCEENIFKILRPNGI
jgi:hypothetical protein